MVFLLLTDSVAAALTSIPDTVAAAAEHAATVAAARAANLAYCGDPRDLRTW